MIESINDKLIDKYNKDKRKAIRILTKSGFVNVDGKLNLYDPNSSKFIEVKDSFIETKFIEILNNNGNYWDILLPYAPYESLLNELPLITKTDVLDFTLYLQWVNTPIDDDLIQELMDKAIADNNSLKSDNDFKGKYDLVSQMLILRNNDVFSNGKVLLKLEDGNFTVFKSDKVMELLNKEIVGNGKNIPLQLVKNNYRSYVDNLTDIKQLSKLTQMRDKKASILSETKPGYEKVLKVISKYS